MVTIDKKGALHDSAGRYTDKPGSGVGGFQLESGFDNTCETCGDTLTGFGPCIHCSHHLEYDKNGELKYNGEKRKANYLTAVDIEDYLFNENNRSNGLEADDKEPGGIWHKMADDYAQALKVAECDPSVFDDEMLEQLKDDNNHLAYEGILRAQAAQGLRPWSDCWFGHHSPITESHGRQRLVDAEASGKPRDIAEARLGLMEVRMRKDPNYKRWNTPRRDVDDKHEPLPRRPISDSEAKERLNRGLEVYGGPGDYSAPDITANMYTCEKIEVPATRLRPGDTLNLDGDGYKIFAVDHLEDGSTRVQISSEVGAIEIYGPKQKAATVKHCTNPTIIREQIASEFPHADFYAEGATHGFYKGHIIKLPKMPQPRQEVTAANYTIPMPPRELAKINHDLKHQYLKELQDWEDMEHNIVARWTPHTQLQDLFRRQQKLFGEN